MQPLLRTTAVWIFTVAFWTVALGFHLLSLGHFPADWSRLIRIWGGLVLKIIGIRLELVNGSTLEDRRARVIVVNHQSALDLVWAAAICPPGPFAIGKKEVIYVPVVNLVWWALGFIRIDRSNHAKAIAALAGVSETVVRESRSLFVAPEGTRTPSGEILPFKKGAFYIARQAGVPIYPVVVDGAFELMPKHAFLPKPGTIRVKYLPPVETQGVAETELGAFAEKVRAEMVQALEEIKSQSVSKRDKTPRR